MMSELTVSQQAAVLALLLWVKGYRSGFQLLATHGKDKVSCAGSADDCLQDYQWLCRIRGDDIPGFRLVSHQQRGAPPQGYRFEFDVTYHPVKGFTLVRLCAYSKAVKIHQQQLKTNQDLPHIDQLIAAAAMRKCPLPSPPRRRRRP